MASSSINTLYTEYELIKPGPGGSFERCRFGGGDYTDPEWVGVLERIGGPVQRRVTATDKTQSDGSVVSKPYLGSRVVSFSLLIEGDTLEEREERCNLFERVTKPGRWGRTELRFHMTSGTEVYLPVVVQECASVGENEQWWKRYDVQLLAPDPRLYAVTAKTAYGKGTGAEARLADVDNEGNHSGFADRIRVHGPVNTAVIIKNLATDDQIRWDGTVPSGQFLDIIPRTKQILLNGSTNAYAQLNQSESSNWRDFAYEPKGNVYRLTGSGMTNDTGLEIDYRSCWA